VDKSYDEVIKILTDKDAFKEYAEDNHFKVLDFKVEEFNLEGEKELLKLGDNEGFEKLRLDAKVYVKAKARVDGAWRIIHLRAKIHKGDDYAYAQADLLQSAGRITALRGSVEVFRQKDGKAMLRVKLYVKAATPNARCCIVRRIISRKAHGIVCQQINMNLCRAVKDIKYMIYHSKATGKFRLVDLLRDNWEN
tara:strand:+ start:1187 stop:1768 length:582 start_codon:yes stop_codon:yes gene_type:complete